MTELYIDGVSVPLPADIEISVKHENPFFNKNGEYTYDIELSLNIPVVAQLYGFLNRLNKSDNVKTDRKAVLIADNRVYIDGTEIITGWSDTAVQIQLVSGNSQLNYFIGSDLMISFLDNMPETPTTHTILSTGREEVMRMYATGSYPDIDFCLPTVYDSSSDVLLNNWYTRCEYSGHDDSFVFTWEDRNAAFEEINPDDWIPMPFLCSFLKHLIRSLGYKLVYNAIEDTDWRQLCLLHVQRTKKWNEFLPQWSVKEFLEAVEQFFNARFVIDKKSKDVRLIFNSRYYSNAAVAYVKNVVDEYKVECDNEVMESYDNSNLRYPESSTTYGKLRCIPDEVKKVASLQGVIGMSPEMYFSFVENRRDDTIYSFSSMASDVIYKGYSYDTAFYEVVNQFEALDRGSSETVEFTFRPAELSYAKELNHFPEGTYEVFIPSIGGSVPQKETESSSILDLIESAQSSQPSKPNLFLGYFKGFRDSKFGLVAEDDYPIIAVDRYMNTSFYPLLFQDIHDTLRLSYMNNRLYSDAYEIDYQNPVEFTSYDDNVFDVNSVFVINNKRYICEYIEYKIDERGRAGAWTGKFYPIKISDTETYGRWILSDGKWRDGGVWLDNGRWLDN